MTPETAITIINSSLVPPPGWTLVASDYTHRQEATVKVDVSYQAHQTSRDYVDLDGQPGWRLEWITAKAAFTIVIDDVNDVADLVGRILIHVVRPIREHEDRETFRLAPTGWAPFHPHKADGQRRWSALTGASVRDDLGFGVA